MLDRLPLELVDLVLQLATAPLTSTLDDYIERDRRAMLRACALVCRRDFAAILPQFAGLIELTLLSGGDVMERLSVAVLAGLPNLRVLNICGITLSGDWAGARFPSLVRLYLDIVSFHTDAFPLVFHPDAFPALRALKVRYFCVKDDHTSTTGFPTLPLSLLAQLDMVSLCAGDRAVLPPSAYSSCARTVLEVSSFDLGNAQRVASVAAVQLRHIALRPVHPEYSSPSGVQQSLSELAHLCSLLTPPSSLHLPSSLLDMPSSVWTLHLDQLKQACDQHGVELRWYDGNEDDFFFHFWRYAKKLKAAQQADGEA
ncbi:hypothetical protein JCM10213v2_003375 [Rhodosporidiobolus nylandii]